MSDEEHDRTRQDTTGDTAEACILSVSESEKSVSSESLVSGGAQKFEAVFDRKGKRVPGVVIRGGKYYVRVKHPSTGRWTFRKSPDQSVDGALRLVKGSKRVDTLEKAEAFARVMDDIRQRRQWAGLDRVLKVYVEAAAKQFRECGKPRPATTSQVLNSVRQVLVESELSAGGLSVDDFPSVVAKWAEKKTLAGMTKITAASVAIRCRCVFSKWAVAEYDRQGLKIPPELSKSFTKTYYDLESYVLPPLELRERTIAEGDSELRKRSPIGAVFMLAYYAGMAAADVARCEWSWIDDSGVVKYRRRKTGKRAAPPLPAWVAAEWRAWAAVSGTQYVVPGVSEKQRSKYMTTAFSGWMRAQGWNVEDYSKAGHELRKLVGSLWATKAGLQWAAHWLGDTMEVTSKYYADLLPELAPDPWK